MRNLAIGFWFSNLRQLVETFVGGGLALAASFAEACESNAI